MNKTKTQASSRMRKPLWLKKLRAHMIVRLVPFMLFLAFLAVVYIANGHRADSLVRRTAETKALLKQKQYEYKTLKADLMYSSKETELADAVEPLGLVKPERPPVLLSGK